MRRLTYRVFPVWTGTGAACSEDSELWNFEGEQKAVIAGLKDIVEQYSNLDLDIRQGSIYGAAEGVSLKSGYHFPAGNLPYYCTEI